MSFGDWIGQLENWVFAILAIGTLSGAFLVVHSRNVIHAALGLVLTLGSLAGLFLLLGAEFVAWTLVMVYIGAVIVLFLFGVMITRAPLGYETDLSHPTSVKVTAAIVSGSLFALIGWAFLDAFESVEFAAVDGPTRTADIGISMFTNYVIPFEVMSVLLLAALIGGIVLARQDPEEEDE
jgi:NADH-quinone oxidoreductase subunit J